MYNSGLPEGFLVIGCEAHTDYGFEALQVEAQMNPQLIRILRIIRLKWPRVVIINLLDCSILWMLLHIVVSIP